jgi:ferredoxin
MAKAHQPLHYPHLEINQRCQNCDNCRLICPHHAIIKNGDQRLIDPWGCNLCLLCQQVCPTSAIELKD